MLSHDVLSSSQTHKEINVFLFCFGYIFLSCSRSIKEPVPKDLFKFAFTI
jgi:hypothetical protein